MKIKVGYLGDIYDSALSVPSLVDACIERDLSLLVLCGGISKDYQSTLEYVNALGEELERKNIVLRFIEGNTDLYYKDEIVMNKEQKVRKIRNLFNNNPYYLPTHSIIRRDFRLVGCMGWYDYTFYRGSARKLSEITRKKSWFYSNKDNKYITDPNDYTLGINNTFDVRFTKENARFLRETLNTNYRKHGETSYNIVVGYFKPLKVFLDNGWGAGYRGTFEGSERFHKIMTDCEVTECYFGMSSSRVYAKADGVNYYCCSYKTLRDMEVVEYDTGILQSGIV